MVVISVFGKELGVGKQAQVVLLLLLVCIGLEVVADPYQEVTEAHAVLKKLEVSSLLVEWITFWCGLMIYQSDATSNGLSIFLSLVVVSTNVTLMLWFVKVLIQAYIEESKESAMVKTITRILSHTSSMRRSMTRMTNAGKTTRAADTDGAKKSAVDADKPVDTQKISIELTASKNKNPLYSKKVKPNATHIQAPEPASLPIPISTTRHYDEATSRWYRCNTATGESEWEEDTGGEAKTAARYWMYTTEEGDSYFMPESGEGEAVWHLPEGAEVVSDEEK